MMMSWHYAISQLRIVCSDLHLVTNLDVDNFCDKSTNPTLHEICVQAFLRFSDSSKPSQSVSLIYEFAWLAGIRKSEENLLKTSCKVAPVTKVALIFWWCHDNQKQSVSAREHWCDVSCDIPYWEDKQMQMNIIAYDFVFVCYRSSPMWSVVRLHEIFPVYSTIYQYTFFTMHV